MRVVAFTRDPALGVALNMLDEWEVTGARDLEEAAASARGAVVLLIGLGTTDEGVDAANQLMSHGVTIPAIVVGDQPLAGPHDIPVLIRPFSLDDLSNALDLASKEGARRGLDSRDAEPMHVDAEDERDAMVLSLHPERPVEPPPPPPVAPVSTPVTSTARAPAAAPATPAPAPAAPSASMPAKPLEQQPAPSPVPPESAQRQGLPPLPTSAVKERLGIGAGKARLPRLRRSHPEKTETDASPIVRDLRLAATGARAIERLVDELPILSDLQAMANAMMGEVVEAFRPETASLMLKRVEGFVPISSSGLSKTEQHMVVADDHPLIVKLLETNDPILIAPVDLALGLVAGIGGARTQALIAAPLMVDNHCIAVLIVGRHGFEDAELDTLDQLAREAAPGLAVAQLLQRLRARRT